MADADGAKGWNELAQATVQDILDTHGGLAALFPLLCFITIWVVISFSNRIIKDKQKEMDRMADSRERLEKKLLSNRLSTRHKAG